MTKKTTVIAQQVTPIKNGLNKDHLETVQLINGRTFETRAIPRYDVIPPMPSNLPKAHFSPASEKVLTERYLMRDGNSEIVETLEERFWKLSYDVASADFDFGATKTAVKEKAKQFYQMMINQQFEPNSPTIMNAGKQNGLQYSACFVLPIEDSIEGIFNSIKYAAMIHKSGGGTGFAFSRLRSNGSNVKTTGGVASGPVSFLKVFNAATESIKQGGTRRGANMGILRVDHPDILEFIRCKAVLDDANAPVFESIAPLLPNEEAREYFQKLLLDRQISNFNISVAVTDKFMEAYSKGEDYDLVNPRTKEVVGKLNSKEVFDEIIDHAWHTGDPGIVFIDRINHSSANPVQELEEIEATNPCGEQPLAPWDACNLGSINLGQFVTDGQINWDQLRETTQLAVEMLDDVVQVNPYTLRQIYDEVHKNRRIGLGVMGWADMLFKLKIAYNSKEALDLAERVMKFINEAGHLASENLAAARGAFPNWAHSIYKNGKPLRNSTVTTIAPTGSISIIANCSSGIEPVFALAYIHRAKTKGNDVRTLVIANQTFEEIAKREGFYSDDLAKKVMDNGSVLGIDEVPSEWQKVFVTASEITPSDHVKMQAAFQKYTDNGVSKTINLPNSATKDDIAKAYLLAWETDCKGITVYRDGSKAVQVLNISNSLKKPEPTTESPKPSYAPRPMVLPGKTYKVTTPLGEGFVTINKDENNHPFEVFVTIGRGGMHTMADAEALGRTISLTLRLTPPGQRLEIAHKIVRQLRGIGGSSHIGFGKERVMSLPDAIAKVLAEDLARVDQSAPVEIPLQMAEEPSRQLSLEQSPKTAADLCPECGDAAFVMEEGCKKCHSCGYSMC